MEVKMEPGWKEALAGEFDKPYFEILARNVHAAYADATVEVYPAAGKIFAAFDATPFDRTKVVVLGQDPYHGPGQANGLAFSVNPGVQVPPSLRNIFAEVHADTGASVPADGDLSRWAEQGVLLLNNTLTVVRGHPKSHAGIGWESLTDAAVKALATRRQGLVYLLWGADAARKGAMIPRDTNLVLTAPHPSPLSAHRGFLGCHHFSQANRYLQAQGKSPIIW